MKAPISGPKVQFGQKYSSILFKPHLGGNLPSPTTPRQVARYHNRGIQGDPEFAAGWHAGQPPEMGATSCIASTDKRTAKFEQLVVSPLAVVLPTVSWAA
jgi:hypothetical protein